MTIRAINPTTGETINTYTETAPAKVAHTIAQAHDGFLSWKQTSMAERAQRMHQAAKLLRDQAPAYALLMAQEMGKPVKDGRAEVEKCAWVCDFYAEQAAQFLRPEVVETEASRSFVTFQPLGVILAVMPWNFPFWQVFRFAAPALMAGNAGVLKHASNVPGCALAIAEVFRQAGFPEHLFETLLIGSAQVDAVIEHPLVMAVTLTGSTPAGQAVASKAGALVKKTVLELGGSDPYIILADADIEASVRTCVASRLINSGQSCIAAKRFIVVESIQKQVEAQFVAEMRAARMGDPLDAETTVGPLARHDLRDDLHQQVQASIAKGAHCVLGGTIPEGPGAFYPPTVLTHVSKGMPAYDEELFGPVAAIIAVPDEAGAIHVANDSIFGLGAAVFTQDKAKGERLAAQELEAGCCFVNTFVRSDPRLPFGGVKASGYGRELSHYGIKEFVNIKTVYVQ
jgi:succinate-semialdehyde dehydrogenase / glutarate-semialdehyde dehydrogenase